MSWLTVIFLLWIFCLGSVSWYDQVIYNCVSQFTIVFILEWILQKLCIINIPYPWAGNREADYFSPIRAKADPGLVWGLWNALMPRMSSSGIPKCMLEVFLRALALWWVWNLIFCPFFHFEVAKNFVLLFSPSLFGFLVSFSMQPKQKVNVGKLTECWALSSAPCFILGSCQNPRVWTELQVLSF